MNCVYLPTCYMPVRRRRHRRHEWPCRRPCSMNSKSRRKQSAFVWKCRSMQMKNRDGQLVFLAAAAAAAAVKRSANE